MKDAAEDIKIYFQTIPAHQFLHIKNYESNGYWDFWQKQSQIPGQDCETICRSLDGIKGKLDDLGGKEANSGSGQIMAYKSDPLGRLCGWGYPRIECYGVRLPMNYDGEIPPQLILEEIQEGGYIVFEHGPFSQEDTQKVDKMIEDAMETFDYQSHGYVLDREPGRMAYFYHDPLRFWKYVRPVIR